MVEGRAGKLADNVYVRGSNEEEFVENVVEVCRRFKAAKMRASLRKTIIGSVETTKMGWN